MSVSPLLTGQTPTRIAAKSLDDPDQQRSIKFRKRVGIPRSLLTYSHSKQTMTSELITLFDYYEKEKGIDRRTMIEAVEAALLSASRKSVVGRARELRVEIDEKKGTIRAIAQLIVVEDVEHPYDEIKLGIAQKNQSGSQNR